MLLDQYMHTSDSMKSISARIEKLYPSPLLEKKEYLGEIALLELHTGGEYDNMTLRHFSADAITGDISSQAGLQFYAMIIGFTDKYAKDYCWGMDIKQFKDFIFYKKQRFIHKIIRWLLKFT